MHFQSLVVFFMSSFVFKARTRIVGTIFPTTLPNKCDAEVCQSVSHCHSVVTLPGSCCPVCSCFDSSHHESHHGDRFIIDKPHSCRQCECQTFLGVKFSTCHRVVCKELSCRETYKPPGECCRVCKIVRHFPVFPEIPDKWKHLGLNVTNKVSF
ncbi:kielin/chordin-like protein isoform X1 [Hydra vulgaris]|uniref:kielin/chordin-like protein isoform X1 n=1 Tax=Hydra vulgaris TaxID=6087 RepID=UPI00019252CA|nr:kielin/chordin-like protein [Hydra vulgaris]